MNSSVVLILVLAGVLLFFCYFVRKETIHKVIVNKEEINDAGLLISPTPEPQYESPPQLNVPVPRGSLKLTSEKYRFPFYKQNRPLNGYDYFKPYGPNQASIVYADAPYKNIPFYTSVSSFAPFPEVNTRWEKVGLLTTVDPQNEAILNLYRRPIAPLQDLFDYAVQDKDGFIIKLRGVKGILEDGDIVPEVIGKENLGSWKVSNFVKDKYVWF